MDVAMNLNKKTMLLVGLVGVVIFLISMFNRELGICGVKDATCWGMFEYPGMLAIFFVPMFVFSLATYFMQEQIFQSWRKITLVFLGVLLVLFLISPERPDPMSLAPSKEVIVWYVVSVYALSSTALLAVKSWKLRKN